MTDYEQMPQTKQSDKVSSGGCPEEERNRKMFRVDNLETKINLKRRFDLSDIRREITALDGDKQVVYVGEIKGISVYYNNALRSVEGYLYLTKYERIKGTKKKRKFNWSRLRFEQEDIPYVKDKVVWTFTPYRRCIDKDVMMDIKTAIRGCAFNKGIGLKPQLLEVLFNPIITELQKRLAESQEFDMVNTR
jgi:hypothetical protein